MIAYRLQKVHIYNASPAYWLDAYWKVTDVVRALFLVDHRGIEANKDFELAVTDDTTILVNGKSWYTGTWRYGGQEKKYTYQNVPGEQDEIRISALLAWKPMEDFIELIESGRMEINKAGLRTRVNTIAQFQNYIDTRPSFSNTPKFHNDF